MTKFNRIQRCLRLPRNLRGRDLVVGDLHGHRSLFEQALERLGFDPARDRVLSVGDLTDRGPESLHTLALLEEPWFHAVLGNHELMLMNYLGYYASRLHARKTFPSGSGAWINDALAGDPERVMRLADRIAALPLAIHVDDELPFNVMHGDLQPIGSTPARLYDAEPVSVHQADLLTSSRANLAEALKTPLLGLQFEQRAVQISPAPLGELPITYVGHSPVQPVTVHQSYVYVDQGVCLASTKRPTAVPPTVLDHRQFAYWLHGVVSARRTALRA